jgi:hypothetical protein
MELLKMAAEAGHSLAHTIVVVPHRRRMTGGSEGARRTNGRGASHQGIGNIESTTERDEGDDDLGVEVGAKAEVQAVPAVGAEAETAAGRKTGKETATVAVGGVEVAVTATVARIDREVIGRNSAASKRQRP